MPKTPLEIIRKAEELQNPDVLAEVVLDIEEDVEEMEVKIEEIKVIAETTKKEKGEKGDRGEKGERGEKGSNGKDGKNGVDGKNGTNGKDGKDGKGIDGLNGLDGKDGVNGKDGSPDTGEQIVEKINKQDTKIDRSKIKDLDKDIKELKERPPIVNNIMGGGGSSGIKDIRAGSGIGVSKLNDTYTISNTQSETSPAGSTTQVQFNDAGAFGGDAGLTYNKTTNALTAGNVLVDDEVYGAGWNTSLEVPTKNAVYDKVESVVSDSFINAIIFG